VSVVGSLYVHWLWVLLLVWVIPQWHSLGQRLMSPQLSESIFVVNSLWVGLWSLVGVVDINEIVLVVSVVEVEWLVSLVWLVILVILFLMNKTTSVESLLVIWKVIMTPSLDSVGVCVASNVQLLWPSAELNIWVGVKVVGWNRLNLRKSGSLVASLMEVLVMESLLMCAWPLVDLLVWVVLELNVVLRMSVLKVDWVLHLSGPLVLSVWGWSHEAVSILVESLLVVREVIMLELMLLPLEISVLLLLGEGSSLVATFMEVLVVESLFVGAWPLVNLLVWVVLELNVVLTMSVLQVDWVLHLHGPLILSIWRWSDETISILMESLLVVWQVVVLEVMLFPL
jgi:hypothetical protein